MLYHSPLLTCHLRDPQRTPRRRFLNVNAMQMGPKGQYGCHSKFHRTRSSELSLPQMILTREHVPRLWQPPITDQPRFRSFKRFSERRVRVFTATMFTIWHHRVLSEGWYMALILVHPVAHRVRCPSLLYHFAGIATFDLCYGACSTFLEHKQDSVWSDLTADVRG